MNKPCSEQEEEAKPLTRYEVELDRAAWLMRWRDVAACCHGVEVDGAIWERVTTHYFPLFDAAYEQREPVEFDRLLMNFHVGCPAAKGKESA